MTEWLIVFFFSACWCFISFFVGSAWQYRKLLKVIDKAVSMFDEGFRIELDIEDVFEGQLNMLLNKIYDMVDNPKDYEEVKE